MVAEGMMVAGAWAAGDVEVVGKKAGVEEMGEIGDMGVEGRSALSEVIVN